jgi:hypothetical protein
VKVAWGERYWSILVKSVFLKKGCFLLEIILKMVFLKFGKLSSGEIWHPRAKRPK